MVEIPSSFKTDVFPLVTDRKPEDIARLIIERYHELQQTMLKLPEPPQGERKVGFKAEISRIIKYAPTDLIGREAETKLLNDAWDKVRHAESSRPRVLTIVALGGEGKT